MYKHLNKTLQTNKTFLIKKNNKFALLRECDTRNNLVSHELS